MEQLDFFNTLEQTKHICPVCGNEFEKTVYNRKYCSKKCKKRRKGSGISVCLNCNNHFKKNSNRQKYCSKKCRLHTIKIPYRKSVNGSKKGDKYECQFCGKEFIKLSVRSIHCSAYCQYKVRLKNEYEKRNILKKLKVYDKCICPICGNSFDKTQHAKQCCSIRCASKKYVQENRDRIRTRKRLKNLNRADRLDILAKKREQNKKYRIENLEKRRSYEREKTKKDPIFKIKRNTRHRILYAIKKAGGNKVYKTVDLLGCTALEAKEYIEKQFKEGMTWENHGNNGWHIDHIIPCASFDLTDPEQQKKCFHYTNLQPLWAKENLSKGAKLLGKDIPPHIGSTPHI